MTCRTMPSTHPCSPQLAAPTPSSGLLSMDRILAKQPRLDTVRLYPAASQRRSLVWDAVAQAFTFFSAEGGGGGGGVQSEAAWFVQVSALRQAFRAAGAAQVCGTQILCMGPPAEGASRWSHTLTDIQYPNPALLLQLPPSSGAEHHPPGARWWRRQHHQCSWQPYATHAHRSSKQQRRCAARHTRHAARIRGRRGVRRAAGAAAAHSAGQRACRPRRQHQRRRHGRRRQWHHPRAE